MFVSEWKWKTKIMIAPLLPAILLILVSGKGNTDRKRKTEKNTDPTQTKLNAPQVRYNVKILPK